ncbi:MAG TPA: methionine--tRNA ligase [Polyangiaceae bacterium]|nr:methionine--tRNA ligase [Polyangiaceae bacterium]
MTTSRPPFSFISTAIPYVNAEPHLGYVLEAVIADSIARFRRGTGWRVHHQAGTDDNSLKNAQAAALQGLSTRELVARNAARFRALDEQLCLSWDAFVSTSESDLHRRRVDEIWQRCLERGDIYQASYSGLYCVGCEQFYAESEVQGGCCPEHGAALERIEERNYFFRLSRYRTELVELIESGALTIQPPTRKNEVLAFLQTGLEDFSISRSRERARGWGLPVPGDSTQVIYVWFDALINYLSGLGDQGFAAWQQAERIDHVIGKGILRFHAVYWPALLLSAGLRPPTHVLVHGYLTVEGQKLGKSRGNGIDPQRVTDEFGVDAVRYYLLRHIRTTRDGDYSEKRLREAYASELADQLGNLVQRTLALVARTRDNLIPDPPAPGEREHELRSHLESVTRDVCSAFEGFALHDALESIWRLIAAANAYVDQTAPWTFVELERTHPRQPALDRILYTLLDVIRAVAQLLEPFLPSTASAILVRLGHPDFATRLPKPGELRAGRRVIPGPPLFPKARRPR